MTPIEERNRWIAMGLEPEFMVLGPDDPETGGKWGVMDAECEYIATCDTKELADVLADALSAYDLSMWRIDPKDRLHEA